MVRGKILVIVAELWSPIYGSPRCYAPRDDDLSPSWRGPEGP